MTLRAALASYMLALVLLASVLPAQAPSNGNDAWYGRSRTLDIAGTNPRDSIVLTAVGKHADSLAIAMVFYVGGSVVHRQRWSSDDELADADSLRKSPARLAAFMRTRLDDVLVLVRRERIDPEQVQHMGDAALLKRMRPAPTHHVALSFGFENSLYFVWNAATKRLMLFMECC